MTLATGIATQPAVLAAGRSIKDRILGDTYRKLTGGEKWKFVDRQIPSVFVLARVAPLAAMGLMRAFNLVVGTTSHPLPLLHLTLATLMATATTRSLWAWRVHKRNELVPELHEEAASDLHLLKRGIQELAGIDPSRLQMPKDMSDDDFKSIQNVCEMARDDKKRAALEQLLPATDGSRFVPKAKEVGLGRGAFIRTYGVKAAAAELPFNVGAAWMVSTLLDAANYAPSDSFPNMLAALVAAHAPGVLNTGRVAVTKGLGWSALLYFTATEMIKFW